MLERTRKIELVNFHQGTFIKRYKRFFADVLTSEGKALTLHCPNTGAMTGLLQEGVDALFSLANSEEMKTRKTPGTIEALRVYVEPDQAFYWVGVNTHRANQIAKLWLDSEAAHQELNISTIRREVKLQQLYSALVKRNPHLVKDGNLQMKSRVDFVIERHGASPLLIEVKSATLYQNKQGFFPDAVSQRASQQLKEMQLMQNLGFDMMILYVSQHQAITDVLPAKHIDPVYADLIAQIKDQGVEIKTLPFNVAFYGVSD